MLTLLTLLTELFARRCTGALSFYDPLGVRIQTKTSCSNDDLCLSSTSGWEGYNCSSDSSGDDLSASYCDSSNSQLKAEIEACCPVTCGVCPIVSAESQFSNVTSAAMAFAPSCTCDTPGAGTSGDNWYSCSDGTTGYCGDDQQCFAIGNFTQGQWADGCQVPTEYYTNPNSTYNTAAPWTLCAAEGSTCKCSGTVLYGSAAFATGEELTGGPNMHKQVSESVMCNIGGMGGDPDENVLKQCWCRAAPGTFYCSADRTGWLQYDFIEQVAIGSYGLNSPSWTDPCGPAGSWCFIGQHISAMSSSGVYSDAVIVSIDSDANTLGVSWQRECSNQTLASGAPWNNGSSCGDAAITTEGIVAFADVNLGDALTPSRWVRLSDSLRLFWCIKFSQPRSLCPTHSVSASRSLSLLVFM